MSTVGNEDIRTFVDGIVKENEARRDAAMKEKGLNPYLQLDKGITEFTLLPFKPVKRTSSFGKDQFVFKVEKKNPEGVLVKYDWTVTCNSPIAVEVVKKLLEAPVPLKVMRGGDGKATRYELL